MIELIDKTKALIEKQIANDDYYLKGTSDCDKSYWWTNENISEYLKLVNFEGKSTALSVIASGDQAFNLVFHGISTIDTFDINKLSEYLVFGLKRALILKYDYEQFMFINKYLIEDENNNYIFQIIMDVLPYMEDKYRKFWQAIVDFTNKVQRKLGIQKNLIKMLTLNIKSYDKIKKLNDYLKDKESYDEFKRRLINANISFKNVNAINLGETFKDNSYDLVLLSNILDYFYEFMGFSWTYDEFKKFQRSIEEITNSGGIIFLNYLFYYFSEKNPKVIQCSCITSDNLTDEEIVNFNSLEHEGMLLKRIKK